MSHNINKRFLRSQFCSLALIMIVCDNEEIVSILILYILTKNFGNAFYKACLYNAL